MINEELNCYNCGGFAFDVPKWITPYLIEDEDWSDEELISQCEYYDYWTEYERRNLIREMIEDRMTSKEIEDVLLEHDTDYLLKRFPNLERIDNPNDTANTDRIIAYRLCVPSIIDDPSFDYDDIDFHFRVRIDGIWFEKNGMGPIEQRAFTEEAWQTTDDLIYDSDIVYFRLNKN